ncbi:MAG: hypothetical protein HY738_14445 [Bacteroidia bacterium]|nr:hypothetical protein [Bacteroidia bacterium]
MGILITHGIEYAIIFSILTTFGIISVFPGLNKFVPINLFRINVLWLEAVVGSSSPTTNYRYQLPTRNCY